MNWTRSADIKKQIQRLWDRGLLLSGQIGGETIFPYRLTLKQPTAGELAERFDQVRAWIADVREMKHCRVQFREINLRQLGKNSLPDELWIDTIDDAARWIGKRRELDDFSRLVAITRDTHPELIEWVRQRPLKALTHADHWPQLLAVLRWMKQNHSPGIYLREVSIPHIHSKFIGEHRSILSELLDLVLPLSAVDQTMRGASQFEGRYGFRSEREQIRFRILDPRFNLLPGSGDQDVSVDWETFAEIRPNIASVFIVENKTNFLSFPEVESALVIFGKGFGFRALGAAKWLADCSVYYWGDIDTNGFAILNQLRHYVPQASSLMMDEETIAAFAHLRGKEETQCATDLLGALTAEEQRVFTGLKNNRWGEHFRLEQEHVDWAYAKTRVIAAAASGVARHT